MEDQLTKIAPPVASGLIALLLSLWSSHRAKRDRTEEKARELAEAQAAEDAREAQAARRQGVADAIRAAMDRADEAHERLETARKEWQDGHHRVRGDVASGLVEAYERLREVEKDLAVIHALASHTNGGGHKT